MASEMKITEEKDKKQNSLLNNKEIAS